MSYLRQGDSTPEFGTGISQWVFTEIKDPGAVISLSSLDLELPLAEIYAKITLDPQPAPST